MALPLIIAGAVIGGAGTLMANQAQAEQEAQNAWFYRQQAKFAKQATRRELQLENIRYTQEKGMQTSALSKGGVSTSTGSASYILAQGASRTLDNLLAIKRKGDLDFTLANARGDAAQRQADTYSSIEYNLLSTFAATAPGFTRAGILDSAGEE